MKRILHSTALCCLLPLGLHAQSIVITEIMYNPDSSEANTQTQYIEIANVTAAPIDLDGWTIDDEDADGPNTLPSVSVPAFGIAVIVGSSAVDFTTAWAASIDPSAVIISLLDQTPSQVMFNMANSPSGASEIIQLRNAMATLIDEVNYDDSGDWPSDSPDGPSIFLSISEADLQSMGDTDNDNGMNWASSVNGMNGAINNAVAGVWGGVDSGSPGNFNGGGMVPVELQSFTVN